MATLIGDAPDQGATLQAATDLFWELGATHVHEEWKSVVAIRHGEHNGDSRPFFDALKKQTQGDVVDVGLLCGAIRETPPTVERGSQRAHGR